MKIKSSWRFGIIPFLFLLAGCGGGGSNPTGIIPTACSIEGQNKFVYDVMKDIYLYYDQLPVVNPSDYSSPRALLDDLRVAPDRFSNISDQQAQFNFFEEGTYNGLGIAFTVNTGNDEANDTENDDTYTITFVYDDSSAGRAGLQRGDKILSIDGVSVTQINNDGGLIAFLSSYENDELITFAINSSSSELITKELSKGLVKINTVLKTEVINTNGLNIGYLAFSSFIGPSKAELKTAFSRLNQQNIDELVLDLRYNGGGRIDIAQILASYIAGDTAVGAAVTRLNYNDKNSDLNSSFPFQPISNSVDLDRLYVLTLEGTCSASELLINAMSPVGIEVITIGQTTCGKPVGFRNINFCDKTLSPVSFDVVNEINQGDYFDGIAATCAANDDTSAILSDPNENMFATALYHIENDQCPVARKPSSKKRVKSKEKQINPTDIMRSVY